jgi:predicted DNA-binding transcriptional regulator AlpA
MKSHLVCCVASSTESPAAERVTVSPWVNEQLIPWNQILSAHDVARLTRRRRWICVGLAWFGRFPRKRRFRGRAVGWLRAEVLEWMSRDLRLVDPNSGVTRCRKGTNQVQRCLPLEFARPLASLRRRRRYARRKSASEVTSVTKPGLTPRMPEGDRP